MKLPIAFDEALAARERIRPYLQTTPLRSYEALDEEIGHGIRVLVKHENHQPTNAFKIRNALSALTLLSAEQKRRGVVAATRGNHGQGVALAGRLLGVPVTVCVPVGNSPGKNRAIRGFGAELIEQGRDYDESVEVARALVRERGVHLVHSTNDPAILAGAATIGLEILEQAPDVEAIVVSIGDRSAISSLVQTATTPGSARAADVSTDTKASSNSASETLRSCFVKDAALSSSRAKRTSASSPSVRTASMIG